MKTGLPRLFLGMIALVSLAVGLGFLLAPVSGSDLVELDLPTATARTDVRSTYGGMNLAVGLFLVYCLRRPEWLRPGLLIVGLVVGGFAAGRVVGLIAEGSLSPTLWVLLAMEVPSALLAFYWFRKVPSA